MARTKSSPKKKSAKKSPARAKKTAKRTTKRAAVLTPETRGSLLRPPDGYDELVRRFVDAWNENPTLKVTELSAKKLASMLARAERAFEKESAYEQKVAARMLPLRDARMVAEDAVWRSVLDAYAVAKAQGRRIPALEEAFSFFGDKLGGRRPSSEPVTPAEPTE